jgi:hypothetical protein
VTIKIPACEDVMPVPFIQPRTGPVGNLRRHRTDSGARQLRHRLKSDVSAETSGLGGEKQQRPARHRVRLAGSWTAGTVMAALASGKARTLLTGPR